jgi:hypothetical protein
VLTLWSNYICPFFVSTQFEEETITANVKGVTINAKLQIGKGCKKLELTGKCPL